MAYRPYGNMDPEWSAEAHVPWAPPQDQLKNLAISAALGVGAFSVATNTQFGKSSQGQAIFGTDILQSHWRAVAERSPFSILNTFRVAESLSPFAGGSSKGLITGASVEAGAKKSVAFYEYGADYTSSQSTRDYLKHIVKREAFEGAGLHLPGEVELRYEQGLDSKTGKLLSRKIGAPLDGKIQKTPWKILSSNMALMETAPFESTVTVDKIATRQSSHKTVNTAFHAVLQSFGLTEMWGENSQTKADGVFAKTKDNAFHSRKAYAPIPLEGTRALGKLGLMGAYAQVPFAFGMERTNRLLQGVIDQVPFLKDSSSFLNERLGIKPGVRSGKPLNMFMRYGGKAAKVGVGLAVLQQADWVRRNYSVPGEMIASGAVSASAAYIFNKVKKSGSPRAAFAVGIGTFFGQMILPGFDDGVIPGIATTATKIHVAGAAIGAATGLSTYRKTLEGLVPGISDWKTGALGAITLSIATMPDFIKRGGLPGMVLRKMAPETRAGIGLGQSLINATELDLPKSLSTGLGDHLWEMISKGGIGGETVATKALQGIDKEHLRDTLGISSQKDLSTRRGRGRLYNYMYADAIKKKGVAGATELLDELHYTFEKATETHRENIRNNNIVNTALSEKLDEIGNRYQGRTNFASKVAKNVSGFKAKFVHALFGATMQGEQLLGNALDGGGVFAKHGFKTRAGRIGTIFGGVLALQQLATGAMFGIGSMEGPSELQAIYSGQRKVQVKRGRWWEGGGTPFEGAGVKYHRPHAYVAMMTRSRQKAAWGENEDETSPIKKFFLKNFTYELEKRNYYNRPYPISGAAFEDIPVVGGLLSATIGRLFKPAKLMHTSEYMRAGQNGEIEFKHKPEINGPALSLGGKTPGVPYSPYSTRHVAGGLQYQFRELEGLTGWAKNMVQKSLTGTETFGTQRPVMGSAGSITDPAEGFWDMALGGGLFMTEPIRRFLPRKQTQIQEYNPLMNSMPHWMPDRFKYGDPYRNIDAGHLRLPGEGYAAIHPELKKFSAENYPDIFKYAILGDVAPMSKEFKRTREKLYGKRSDGVTSAAENALMDTTDRLYNERISGQDFDAVDPNAIELPFVSGMTQRATALAKTGIRKAVAPVEYMVPGGFRPVQKLMSDRDSIEEYEYSRLYGTQFAFWDKPIKDWFRPAFYSAIDFMDPLNIAGKPLWRREADAQQGFFDKIEFRKQMQLASIAQMEGRSGAEQFHQKMAAQTRYGVNPNADAMSIYMTLPDSEKKFFDSFSMANTKERKRILEMIPADQAQLYKAVWKRVDQGDQSLYVGSDAAVSEAHLGKQFHGLREQEYGRMMPGEDWIGWHEDVNIDDIEVKYIDSLGKDLHEYGYWHSAHRKNARKSYLEGSDKFLQQLPGPDPFSLSGRIFNAGRGQRQVRAPVEASVTRLDGFHSQGHGNFYMNDDRSLEMLSAIGSYNGGN